LTEVDKNAVTAARNLKKAVHRIYFFIDRAKLHYDILRLIIFEYQNQRTIVMKLTLSKVKHETIATLSFAGGESKRNYYRQTKCKSIFIVLSVNLLFDRQYRSDSLSRRPIKNVVLFVERFVEVRETKTYWWEFFLVFSLNHLSSVACLTNNTSAV
jgi:hypothetical protein